MSPSSRRRIASRALAWLACAGLLLAAAQPAYGQRDKKPPKKPEEETWREDPYTDNKKAAIAEAGYQLLDRITWNEQFGSERVEKALGEVKIRWVETEHFRLGVCLPEIKVPNHPKEVKKRIRAELAELKEKMPKVNVKAKKLDPWLRTHIYALRLEKLYTDFLELVDATDESFPKAGKPDQPGPKSFGRGPFVGCKSKFNVLILTKEGDCRRFLTTFTGADGSGPSRWYLPDPHDGFVFCTAIKYTDGRVRGRHGALLPRRVQHHQLLDRRLPQLRLPIDGVVAGGLLPLPPTRDQRRVEHVLADRRQHGADLPVAQLGVPHERTDQARALPADDRHRRAIRARRHEVRGPPGDVVSCAVPDGA